MLKMGGLHIASLTDEKHLSIMRYRSGYFYQWGDYIYLLCDQIIFIEFAPRLARASLRCKRFGNKLNSFSKIINC